MQRTLLRMVLLGLTCSSASASTIIYDENVDGDSNFSTVTSGFTPLTLVSGSNLIVGNLSSNTSVSADLDNFKLILDPGLSISGITVSITSHSGSSAAWSWLLGDYAAGLGGPIFDSWYLTSTAPLGSSPSTMYPPSTSYPLASGSYFLANNWNFAYTPPILYPSVGYQWDITVATVPIPAAAFLFPSALGLLGWLRRRATV